MSWGQSIAVLRINHSLCAMSVVETAPTLPTSHRPLCFCAGPNPRRAAPGFAPIAAVSVSPSNGAGLARSPSRRVTFQSSDQAQVRNVTTRSPTEPN